MISSSIGSTLIASPSFEERCIAGPTAFLESGGTASSSFFATFGAAGGAFDANALALRRLGFAKAADVNRFAAKSIWAWVLETVNSATEQSSACDIAIDATCIPRESLAIVLFALSLRRERLKRVRVLYTPPDRYATQEGPTDERWLSRGISTIRSILGYPGQFGTERPRHVVALAGHEDDRLRDIVLYLEPTKLSLGNEAKDSSTVPGADRISSDVKTQLRETIGSPQYGDVTFHANSIQQTFESLKTMLANATEENVALVAMNTKLSFIGAALCGLHLRHIRMVYAVPLEYNPLYSTGKGAVTEVDITQMIRVAATIPALPSRGRSG